MIILASSKGQDFSPVGTPSPALPEFLAQAKQLVALLHTYSRSDLRTLMHISQNLAERTFEQFQALHQSMPAAQGKPALLAFNGEMYRSLAATALTAADLTFAQNHLCILSGLYGCLRPLDLIHPYRLEMGYTLPNEKGKTLYPFWRELITDYLNRALAKEQQPILINLASEEYAKVVEQSRLNGPWLDIRFKEESHDGKLKSVAMYAKRARGMMVRFYLRNRIDQPKKLQLFNGNGYKFRTELSDDRQWTFTRPKD